MTSNYFIIYEHILATSRDSLDHKQAFLAVLVNFQLLMSAGLWDMPMDIMLLNQSSKSKT
jgi:hypothetical protein